VGLTVVLRVGDREGLTVLPMKGAPVGKGVGTRVGLGEGWSVGNETVGQWDKKWANTSKSTLVKQ
jgi:hypothetical protein